MTKRIKLVRPNEKAPECCPVCKVSPGEPHGEGCPGERCVFCGLMAFCCDCVYRVNGIDPARLEEDHPDLWKNGPTDEMAAKFTEEQTKLGGPLPWTGETAGKRECIENGWFSVRRLGGPGYAACPPDTPGAVLDLNRYARACAGGEPGFRWDPRARRLVRTHLG